MLLRYIVACYTVFTTTEQKFGCSIGDSFLKKNQRINKKIQHVYKLNIINLCIKNSYHTYHNFTGTHYSMNVLLKSNFCINELITKNFVYL